MKKKLLKILKTICIILLLFLAIRLFSPTWTPYINGENSISELRKVDINGANLEVMIRGSNRNNPILIFVHGGPCCSEIPYVRKYGFAARKIEEEKFYQWMKDTFRNYDFSLLRLLPRQIIHRQRSPMGKILLCQNRSNIILHRSLT